MVEAGGLRVPVPLMFLFADTGVSQTYCLGTGASVALQIQGRVAGILAAIYLLASSVLDGCHSAPSWMLDQVLACPVARCSAVKNKVSRLSGTLV